MSGNFSPMKTVGEVNEKEWGKQGEDGDVFTVNLILGVNE